MAKKVLESEGSSGISATPTAAEGSLLAGRGWRMPTCSMVVRSSRTAQCWASFPSLTRNQRTWRRRITVDTGQFRLFLGSFCSLRASAEAGAVVRAGLCDVAIGTDNQPGTRAATRNSGAETYFWAGGQPTSDLDWPSSPLGSTYSPCRPGSSAAVSSTGAGQYIQLKRIEATLNRQQQLSRSSAALYPSPGMPSPARPRVQGGSKHGAFPTATTRANG